MDGEFWLRAVGLLVFCGVLFVVPVVTLMRDDRLGRNESDPDSSQWTTEQHSE